MSDGKFGSERWSGSGNPVPLSSGKKDVCTYEDRGTKKESVRKDGRGGRGVGVEREYEQ